MKPVTTQRLHALAHQLNTHGRLIATTELGHKIVQHWDELTPGIKAAQTDADGSRSADRISQPEAAVMADRGDSGAQLARDVERVISQLERAIDRLSDLEREVTRKREPIPTQCPSCTAGQIPVGHVRCDNGKCNSHQDTRQTCEVDGCEQVLVRGATGKTKPHKLGDGTPVCGTHAKQAKRKSWHSIADYGLGENVQVDQEGDSALFLTDGQRKTIAKAAARSRRIA